MTFDVAILGGGPAGSLCAAMLRKQAPELSVVVLDKASFPRPTVGEVALPGWADLLDRVGVLDRVEATGPMRKLGVIFSWGPAEAGTTWTADFRDSDTGTGPPGSWHLDRASFDHEMLSHCAELGAEVRQGVRVVASLEDGDLLGHCLENLPAPPSFILLDIVMRRSSGVDALVALRSAADRVYQAAAMKGNIDGEWIEQLHQTLPAHNNWVWGIASDPSVLAMMRTHLGPDLVLYVCIHTPGCWCTSKMPVS